ncbi:MAG: hypothetical protein O2855_06875 [Planctomycetota bacterium]|nr:hypothetical protein [Planctomycetota bacterium]
MNPKTRQLIAMVKPHLALFILGAVALTVPVVGWWFGTAQRATTQKTATELARKLDALKALETTSVSLELPGQEAWTDSVLVNQAFLNTYSDRTKTIAESVQSVPTIALEFNRKGHDSLMDLRKFDQRDLLTIPGNFFTDITSAYETLFTESGAMSPPPAANVLAAVEIRRDRFVAGVFGKANNAKLDEQEQAMLRNTLIQERIGRYQEVARESRFYANPFDVGQPTEKLDKANFSVFYTQQWQLWLVEDIFGAVLAANKDTTSVLQAPVKRVLWIVPDTMIPAKTEKIAPPADDGSGEAVGMGSMGAPIDPSAPVLATNFAKSITGRSSNQLYDVLLANAAFVVETTRIPALVDALAKQNFITIVGCTITPVDSFAAARNGFLYGAQHCSQVELVIETVWLREWTGPMMPDDVRAALGTSGAKVGAPMDDAADGSSASDPNTDSTEPVSG